MRQALARLAPEQRAAVVMRYHLELSEAEMTQAQRRPLSTVKWLLRSAKKRLPARYFKAAPSFTIN